MAYRWAVLGAVLVALAGCADRYFLTRPPGIDISPYTTLGYRQTADTPAAVVLTYSGPINRSVVCRTRGGRFAPVEARPRTSGNQVQDIQLNAYLQASKTSGSAGPALISDGIYVVTITTRPAAGAPASSVESITFSPRGSASFRSGLTCRPA
jgi:hypothetical protein